MEMMQRNIQLTHTRGGLFILWASKEVGQESRGHTPRGAIYFRVCNCLRRKLAEKGARVEPPRCFKCFKMNFPEFAQLLAEEGHIVSNKSNK